MMEGREKNGEMVATDICLFPGVWYGSLKVGTDVDKSCNE